MAAFSSENTDVPIIQLNPGSRCSPLGYLLGDSACTITRVPPEHSSDALCGVWFGAPDSPAYPTPNNSTVKKPPPQRLSSLSGQRSLLDRNSKMTTTRSQTFSNFERLKKLSAIACMRDDTAKELMSVSKSILDTFPVVAPDGSSIPLPEPEVVETLMKDLLPAPIDIFSEQFFRSLLFPIVMLKDIASLYGFIEIEDDIMQTLQLSHEEKTTRTSWLTFGSPPF